MQLTPGEVATIVQEHMESILAMDKRSDQRTAAIMALLANCHRSKNAPIFKPDDFLARTNTEFETPEQEAARFDALLSKLT